MSKIPVFLLLLSMSTFSYAASKNLCDELKESGSSVEAVQKCWDNPKYGKSDYAKQKEIDDLEKKNANEKKEADYTKKKSNLEIKKFTEAELLESGFGKPFFASKRDTRYVARQEKRVTTGDALCNYLGYEKAMKSSLSNEFYADREGNLLTDKKGLIVDTNIFGRPSGEAELYRDEDRIYSVRKFVEITCAKRMDKELDSNNEALKLISEQIEIVEDTLNQKSKQNSNVNNGSRSVKPTVVTPYGYKPPYDDDKKSLSK